MMRSRTRCDSARAIETTCCRGGAQGPHVRVRRDVAVVQAHEQLRRLPPHPGPVEQPGAARLVTEEHALGHRQVLHQVELLIDRRDAAGQRLRRLAGRQRIAVDEDLALRGRDHAGYALDQRRLAGAVRAEQAVHLAGVDVEVDPVERAHARVLLGDAADLEERGRRAHRDTASAWTGGTSTHRPSREEVSTASVISAARRPSAKTGMPSAGSAPSIAA